MANMILGMILLQKRYTSTKYTSVVMITVGIAVCTIMSGQEMKRQETPNGAVKDGDPPDEDEAWELIIWITGICMLTFALFVSARMGIYQEVIYQQYGKHPKEALFYAVRGRVSHDPYW